ncbi:protein decapping 5-like [Cornus florida]|uniref:protein decapping 5-like n=1 Tax=Cornus florida TaxID=4283 RepID=UPI0028991A4E|nr:protein decapping 5-like [Cornus florida]XP_059663078.1 protein decapping 5-like [Cornus florida]
MAYEYSKIGSSSSASPSSSSSSAADSYVGSLISLTSKYEIRYEGVLYFLNPQDSTLGLKSVRCFGTEGRNKDGPQIPPSDKVYEYIMFRGSDIKDLQVKSPPPSQKEEPIHNDPAIIQSHCSMKSSSSSRSVSVGGGSLTEFSSYQEPPALTSRGYPGALTSYQTGAQVGPSGHLQTSQTANMASFVMPMFWQGHDGTSNSISYAPQHPFPIVPMSASTQAPTTLVSTNLSDSVAPASSLITNSVNSNIISGLTPEQHSTFPTNTPPSFMKPSMTSHPALLTTNGSYISSGQEMNTIKARTIDKAGFDPVKVLSVQSLPCSVSSVADSTSGPLLKLPPTLLTPDQLTQPKPRLLSPAQQSNSSQKDIDAMYSASPNFPLSMTNPVVQGPLLPLPLSAQQSQYSMPQFTEEFDFEAMNEKFKKDEVWGYLGNAKQQDEKVGMVENEAGQNLGDEVVHGSVQKFDSRSAYNKDEFFDTISCNSLARGGRNGQIRFVERMKMDTETFGNFQQRPHLSYGGQRAGRGEDYRGSYSRGRGYNYGGRGRAGNWRM